MSRRERRWCVGYAVVLAALTSLPYLLGFAAQGDAWRFSGFVFGVEDGNSYIAKMLLGADGAWLFRTPYTTDPQGGVLAYLPYLLLGKLASGPGMHEQLVALFHLARVLVIPLEVLATYQFAALFLGEERRRRWSVILATAGGGLGWLLVALGKGSWLGSLPLDLHSPESFGFLAVYGLPHLVLGRALLLWGLVRYLHALERPRLAWGAGALWFALGLVQPIQVASGYAAVLAHGLAIVVVSWVKKDLHPLKSWGQAAARLLLISLPPMIYTALAFTLDPYLRIWSEQNRILSPHPLHYLAAYGLMAVPAIAGIRSLLDGMDRRGFLLVAWVLALPAMAYAPHNLQRRLPDGVWVALTILAAAGLASWTSVRQKSRWLARVLLVASLPSTVLLLAGGVWTAARPAEPAFLPAAEAEAMEWIAGEAGSGSVVLASYSTSNALPAWAPVRVVAGHGPESAFLDRLLPQVEAFFSQSTPDDQRLSFLKAYQVGWVFYGPSERNLGGWNPDEAEFLERVHETDGYWLYRVRPDRLVLAGPVK